MVLAAFLLTLSCSDSRVLGPASTEEPLPPPNGPSDPRALISDALHDGGNTHFFWLAPMVPDPAAFNGDFDDSQSPVVRICDLSDCGSLEIAAYSMDTGPGSETVRVVPTDEHYIVNWHTDQFDVTAGPTYRITVGVSGTELGYADIQLATNGGEVKNVTTHETIGLKDGRTLPIKFRIEEGAVFVISATDGGTIEALDGSATLEIPAGALDEETGITIESVPPSGEEISVVELGPDGTTFSTPVIVTLGYDETALGGYREDQLALNTFEDGEWIIVPGFVRDPIANTISAPFHHFSSASVGPASKALVCPGDANPNTFELFDDALAALNDGGTLTVCAGTHTVQGVTIGKGLTIQGKTGTRPTLQTAGARFGFITNFSSGTLTIRNLRLETYWNINAQASSGSALLIQGAHDQVIVEDVDLEVLPGPGGVVNSSGLIVAPSGVPGAHVTVQNVTGTGGRNGIYVWTTPNASTGASVEIRQSTLSAQRGVVVFDQSVNSAQGAISDVDIDSVDIDANLGVYATRGNGGVGARVDVTNSSFSGGALWYQSGATGLIQGNTIDCGHGAACIRVRSGANTTQPEPIRIIGNQLTEVPGGTRDAIWLTELDAGPFEITDNQIDGTSAGGDRSDPFDYSFHGDGLRFENLEASGTVTGNTISGAYRALSTDAGSVATTTQDNTIATVWTGAGVVNGGQMSVHSSDITDYIVPIDPAEAFNAGDLTCNWWGDPNGPQGVDAGIAANVYTPWATSSGATSCTGGAFVVDGSGGTVNAAGGAAVLDVPAGALSSQTAIVVDPTSSHPGDQGLLAGTVYDFQPDGTSFAPPATLTLSYAGAALNGLQPGDLTILTEDNGEWIELPSTVDTNTETVTAQIDGFSKKGVGGKVATVDVTPASVTINEGETLQLTATPKDAAGNPMNRRVNWTSLDTNVATVDNTGLVTGLIAGTVTIEASSGGALGIATIAIGTPAFSLASVTSAYVTTCGVTPAGAGYCWGSNDQGQLGDGSTTNSSVPVLVSGGLSFDQISAGSQHTCALTISGQAYCWGFGGYLALGTGTNTSFSVPVPVSGGLSFQSIAVGRFHSCGLTVAGSLVAYCWGSGSEGRLGNGGGHSSVPTAVAGGVPYNSLVVGYDHTCGLTPTGRADCWGSNAWGQLGIGTNTDANVPTPVSGNLVFSSLSAGGYTTCGITTSGESYCWGLNQNGNLGDGTLTSRNAPVLVSGGLDFESIQPGVNFTCGIDTAGSGYCWGAGSLGSLGDGTNTGHTTIPVLVSGGLVLQTLGLGSSHACGITTSNHTYCWGWNSTGQLGDGTTANRNAPTPVSSP